MFPQSDYERDPNLSLKEKLHLKYEERKQNPLPSPVVLNRTAQSCYIFGAFGVAFWGVVVAIPFLYSDSASWVITAHQLFGTLCFVQLMINWFCIRLVDTSYKPNIHGVLPDTLKLGDNIHDSPVVRLQNGVPGSENGGAMTNENLFYVSKGLPDESGIPKRKAFPYFCWAPCLPCNRPRPPRCFHCPLCNKCVLKRDHHCFFAGACVGYRNMRHFVVFVTWAVIGTVYATLHCLPYYYLDLAPNIGYLDIFTPVAIVSWLLGYIHFKIVILTLLGWILGMYTVYSIVYLLEIWMWIRAGKTSFEFENNIKVVDERNLQEKIRSVFGDYWFLNFFFPLHFVFEPVEDPVTWKYVKA